MTLLAVILLGHINAIHKNQRSHSPLSGVDKSEDVRVQLHISNEPFCNIHVQV